MALFLRNTYMLDGQVPIVCTAPSRVSMWAPDLKDGNALFGDWPGIRLVISHLSTLRRTGGTIAIIAC
jgi:hypothetical protein